MRLTACVPLSLAAFGLVVALPAEEGQPPLAKKHRVEILSDPDFSIFVTRKDIVPRMDRFLLHPLSDPFAASLNPTPWRNDDVVFPPPKGGGGIGKGLPKFPLNNNRPKSNSGFGIGKNHGPGVGIGNALGNSIGNTLGNIGNNLGKGNFPGLLKGPMAGRRGTKCSQQQVECKFLKDAAYKLQNDDDECVKIATTFDDQGRIKFDPIMQNGDNIIYGVTTDGLSASAWCNDIGWALRKIYTSCRKRINGKDTCYGGDAYAARNTAFLVSVGPRVKNG